MAQMGQMTWMSDHSGETGLDSGTETGIETGIERGTEALEVEGVHLVMEGGEEAVIEWMGGTGSEAGRKTEAITEEVDGRETEIGTEIGIVIGTDGTGGRGEAAWIATESEGGVRMGIGSEGGGREEKEEGEKEGAEREGEELREKKGTGQGGQNGEREPRDGIGTIDWQNLKIWKDFGPLTAQSNLV